jgi:small GTP-binding protein
MEAVDAAVEPDDLIAAFFDKERTNAVIAEAEATSIPVAGPMDVAPAGTSAYLDTADHRAGFVSIVGKPNVGKSTLMNAILGTRLSIITSKAQTTRHRIMGIMNGDDYQIVYSDTPGVLIPQYKLQEGMMRFVQGSINDADVIVVVVDIFQDSSFDEKLLRQLRSSTAALLVLLNKVDLMPAEEADEDEDEDGAAEGGGGAKRSRRVTINALGSQDELMARWEAEFDATVLPISARYGEGLDAVLERIKALLPRLTLTLTLAISLTLTLTLP